MLRARLASYVVVGAVALTACGGPSDSDKADIVDLALRKVVVGGQLGDCLNIAGYDVDPKFLQGSIITAPGDGWYRVAFQNEKDTGKFIHVGVNVKASTVVPYKAEDQAQLSAVGCALNLAPLL